MFHGLFLSTDVQVTVALSAHPLMDSWLAELPQVGAAVSRSASWHVPGLVLQVRCVCNDPGILVPESYGGRQSAPFSYPGVWSPGDPFMERNLPELLGDFWNF